MDEIKLKFERKNTVISPYKERDAEITKSLLLSSTFNSDFEWDGYGKFFFDKDDHAAHQFPIIKETHQNFQKNDDVLIFNMKYNEFRNCGVYDKMIVFHNDGVNIPSHGIFFYNTKTKRQVNFPFITGGMTDFLTHVNKLLYRIKKGETILEYLNRYKDVKRNKKNIIE